MSKQMDWNSIILFYKRRILRLLPALYLVLFFTAVISLFLDTPHASKNIGQAIIATTTYLANVFYYTEIDYFNEFQSVSPLVHTWSLSLEEQFYLLFPILFFLLRSQKKELIGFMLLLSISFIFYVQSDDILYRHYMPHLRIWQLLIGVIFALVNFEFKNKFLHLLLTVISLYILFGAYTNDYINIIITIGIALSIVLRDEFGDNTYKYFVLGGAMSYSLYLWHQPILYFGKILDLNDVFLLLLIVMLSYLSYRYVETPLRYSKERIAIFGIGITTMLLLSIGYSAHTTRGWFNVKKSIYGISNVDVEFDYETLLLQRNLIREKVLSMEITDSTVMIFGDSKAEDLVISLYCATGERYNLEIVHANDYDLDLIRSNSCLQKSIRTANKIIFTNTWRRGNIDNVVGIIKSVNNIKDKEVFVLSTSNFEDVSSQYFAYIRKNEHSNVNSTEFKSVLRSDWQRQSNELKQEISHLKEVIWIDKEDAFLNRRNGFIRNNQLTIYDTGHLSYEGFNEFGEWISPIIGLNLKTTAQVEL
jgi:peptidoglycan/LPS O-acetylase OafA/YrhL